MTDRCPICDWKDAENCNFKPGECLETHLRMAHPYNSLDRFLLQEVGF